MRKSVVLTVALAALLCYTLPVSAQVQDHLQCRKAKKDDLKFAKATAIVDLASALPEVGCKVKLISKLDCFPAEKTLVDSGGAPVVPFAGGEVASSDYLCYRMKCGREVGTAVVTDQFGTRRIEFASEKILCAPAQVE